MSFLSNSCKFVRQTVSITRNAGGISHKFSLKPARFQTYETCSRIDNAANDSNRLIDKLNGVVPKEERHISASIISGINRRNAFPVPIPIEGIRSSFASSLLAPPHSNLTSGLACTTPLFTEASRNIIKFSLRKGRRKTARAVKNRFYRLDWGAWISPIPGRARHLWKKSIQQRNYLKNHIFRNAREVKLLEKMVTKYWIKKKWFVNDPYENYHTRDNFRNTKGVQGINSTLLHYAPRSYTIRKWPKNR